MPPLTIEFEGLVASLDVPTDRAWEVLRYAHIGGKGPETNNGGAPIQEPPPHYFSPPNRDASQAGQIRDVACEVLADGRPHERREISKAVRDAGLKTANLDGALKGHFERAENVMGRPTYRRLDWADVVEPRKKGRGLNWDPTPATENGHGIQVLGRLGDAD